MAGYENTTIIGHVGRDVEMRHIGNGASVASFTVAVSRSWTDTKSGERREVTNWYKVSAWARLGEVAAQYVKKGAQIMVVGTVTANAYRGQDGEPRASLELRADTFQLLGSRGESNEEYAPPVGGGYSEDIPFDHDAFQL